MSTTAPSIPMNLEFGNDHVEALPAATEEPVDALATKVFLFTIAYAVVFVTVAVILVS